MGDVIHYYEGTKPQGILGGGAPVVDMRHWYRGHLLDKSNGSHLSADFLIWEGDDPWNRQTEDRAPVSVFEAEDGIITSPDGGMRPYWDSRAMFNDEVVNL